jgi:protocatechuate 3,4-dioxygenase beta subunit
LKQSSNVRITYKTIGIIAIFLAAGILAASQLGLLPGMGGPMGKVLTAAEKKACGLTAEVTEGPYFVSGTDALPEGNLNYSNLPGEPLSISGYVFEGLDTAKPLANAKLEIWHADNSGSYHPNRNGPATNYKMEEIALRGFVTTDATGAYKFTTVYPGEYSGRTRHIHFRINATGFPELTTQLILPAKPGDALTFDDDTVSKGLPDCQLLKVDSSTSPASASFDFHVSR